MLIQFPGAAPESIANIDGEFALSRLRVLLSQQERLLDHPWADADLYLYDLRAEEIRDLIAQLENNRPLEAEVNSSRGMESPTTNRFTVSSLVASEVGETKPYSKELSRRLVGVATSSWKPVRVSFTRIRYLLSRPFFHHGSARDSASRGRCQPQFRLSP
jgi:hypothetical protein